MSVFRSRILIVFSIVIFLTGCSKKAGITIENHTVKKGEFVVSLTETGELEAINSKMIYSPAVSYYILSMLKITKIVEDGKQVEEGEILIEFDKSDVNKAIADATGSLEIAKAELRKAMVTHESQLEELESSLETAKLNQQITELNLEMKQHSPEMDRQQMELDLEKSNINLERAKQEIDNKKSIQKEEINTLELKVQQAENKLEESERTLDMLSVKAPSPGIAIISRNWMTRQKWAVNDQSYSGRNLIGLPDLRLMKANVEINEVDISKIEMDQKAIIKLDAFPDKVFPGIINDVATLARLKNRDSKVKVFDVAIRLDENKEKLMPGMTVSCEIIMQKIPDALSIPLEALFMVDGKNIVYLKNGSGYKMTVVTPGVSNDNFVIITDGLSEDDVVALSDPTEQFDVN